MRCGLGGEGEGVSSSSSKDTIDSSLDLCKNFLADKQSKTQKSDYLSATKFAKSPTPTDSEGIAYVAALRVVILALRHLCLPKNNCRPLVNQTQQIDFLRPL